MNPAKTTARPSVDLDTTDSLPVLDIAAYEAQIAREGAPSDGAAAPPDSGTAAAALPAADNIGPNAAPPAPESDVMLSVEHWIVQKTEELRAHYDALSLAQHEHSASELEVARSEATRLAEKLIEVRAGEAQQAAALTAAGALLEQRAVELKALQVTQAALIADGQRAASELSALEARLRDSEARERGAQQTIEAQNRTQAELTNRVQQEIRARERLAADVEGLQGQLASCVESLHNRESYRTIYESTLQELDIELETAQLETAAHETRAQELAAELQSRDRRLQDAVRERDEARRLHDTESTRHAAVRGEDERTRSSLESQLAELTTRHTDVCAQLVTKEQALTAAQRRAESDALASGSAAARQRELESAVASRQTDLTEARLEIDRNRGLLADITAALVRSQTMFADQGRQLEERDAAASAMAASHAEQSALITLLRSQIEALTARLATPETERHLLEERVASLTKEVADSDSRLTRLESMNAGLRATVGQLNTSLAERDAELQRATQMASMNAYALGRVQSSIDALGRSLTAPESPPTQAQVSILTRIDGGNNHSVVLRGRTTIGRDHDNDLALPMRSVSRRHAVLIPAFRTAFVQDLHSTNGVLVNHRRVRCARLEHGDLVNFGEAQFRYTVAPAPAGAASAGSSTPPRHLHR